MKISFSRAREKNLNHFSSRISRDRDSCQCLGHMVKNIYLSNTVSKKNAHIAGHDSATTDFAEGKDPDSILKVKTTFT